MIMKNEIILFYMLYDSNLFEKCFFTILSHISCKKYSKLILNLFIYFYNNNNIYLMYILLFFYFFLKMKNENKNKI